MKEHLKSNIVINTYFKPKHKTYDLLLSSRIFLTQRYGTAHSQHLLNNPKNIYGTG